MCNMLSWIVWKGKTYVITNDTLETNAIVKEYIATCNEGKDSIDDLVGHGMIRKAFNIPPDEGVEYENSYLAQPEHGRKGSRENEDNRIPKHLIKRIKNGEFSSIGYPRLERKWNINNRGVRITSNLLTDNAAKRFIAFKEGTDRATSFYLPSSLSVHFRDKIRRSMDNNKYAECTKYFWKLFSDPKNRKPEWK